MISTTNVNVIIFTMNKVAAAIVTYNHQILLLLRDTKPSIKDPDTWCLVGGHVNEGEDFEEAIRREAKEEICIEPKEYAFLFRFDGAWNEDYWVYHIPLTETEAKQVKLGDEGQEIKFFKFEEIKNLKLAKNLELLYQTKQKEFREVIES